MRGNFLGKDKSVHIHVMCMRKKVNRVQIILKCRGFFLLFFFHVLYREIVNVKDRSQIVRNLPDCRACRNSKSLF